MLEFQASDLWKRTLADVPEDPHADVRSELRSAFFQFRGTVKPLANEIAISMPMFTDHSIDHIDALWDTASLVCGPDYPINPVEAFVLGGAFLLHDLGMGLAAFPNGEADITNDPLYQDTVTLIQRTSPGLSAEKARVQALTQVLRLRHASQAEKLVRQEFTTGKEKFYLLQDTKLRASYGGLIGRIAHSHWFAVSELSQKFGTIIGALPGFPSDWTVDPFKIACILRLADAAQIDSRRAPLYLHAFRKPAGESDQHWTFQERLTLPMLEDDRLKFTSTSPFEADESESWWLAYETIRMINNELRHVDAACADLGKRRFAARAVAGAEDPLRFAEYVPTDSWTPIDASLRVTNVSRVVRQLGGEALYGDEPMVGLRELISNAADATRTRRIQYGGTDLSILVSLRKEADQWVLRVVDHGIGMTAPEMVTCLTDFGTSHWTSPDRIREYPGLLAKGFRSTGRFGIGFYAAFMLADMVSVRSLKARAAASDTAVLAFQAGVDGRPLLRQASEAEQLDHNGTAVELILKAHPGSRTGLLGFTCDDESLGETVTLALRNMCALIDVDLYFQGPQDEKPQRILSGDEWRTLPADDLYDLLYREPGRQDRYLKRRRAFIDAFRDQLEDILDDNGDVIGRAALGVQVAGAERYGVGTGHVYVGGMRADSIYGTVGCFVGEPMKADRSSAFPIATPETLWAWADSQGQKALGRTDVRRENLVQLYQTVAGLGQLTSELPFGSTSNGLINDEDLENWLGDKADIVVLHDHNYERYDNQNGFFYFDTEAGQRVEIPTNAVVMNIYTEWLLPDEVMSEPLDETFLKYVHEDNLERAAAATFWYFLGIESPLFRLLHTAGKVWGCDPYELALSVERCEQDLENGIDNRIESKIEDGTVSFADGLILRRPKA